MTRRGDSLLRFVSVCVLLTAASLFLLLRSQAESLPPRADLAAFPVELDGRQGRTLTIEPEILEILGKGEFLSRIYARGDESFIDLFIAYFPSQRAGDTIHSPKNCLPGAGWSPVESATIQLTGSDGSPFLANRYVIGRGADRQVVLYWYQAHGRAVSSEYWAKFYLVADAIRMNRTDGALVRVVTPVGRGESLENGEKRAVAFARQVIPHLDRYIPR